MAIISCYSVALELNSAQGKEYPAMVVKYCQPENETVQIALLEGVGESDPLDLSPVLKQLLQEHETRSLNMVIVIPDGLGQVILKSSVTDAALTISKGKKLHLCAPKDFSDAPWERPVIRFEGSTIGDIVSLEEGSLLTLQNLILSASRFSRGNSLFSVKQGSSLHLINTIVERYLLPQKSKGVNALVYLGRHSKAPPDLQSDTPYFTMEGEYSALISHRDVDVIRGVDSVVSINGGHVISTGEGLVMEASKLTLNGVTLWGSLSKVRAIMPEDLDSSLTVSYGENRCSGDLCTLKAMLVLVRSASLLMTHSKVQKLQGKLLNLADQEASFNPESHHNQYLPSGGAPTCLDETLVEAGIQLSWVFESFLVDGEVCKPVINIKPVATAKSFSAETTASKAQITKLTVVTVTSKPSPNTGSIEDIYNQEPLIQFIKAVSSGFMWVCICFFSIGGLCHVLFNL